MECWGAQGGGTSSYPGGKGAYTFGIITLQSATPLYVVVGQAGDDVTNKTASNDIDI
ncbi:MAG: fimbrillin family protein, partial [Prevotella sp.]|nr:fimbrillin family protein [Prevotella sp.]